MAPIQSLVLWISFLILLVSSLPQQSNLSWADENEFEAEDSDSIELPSAPASGPQLYFLAQGSPGRIARISPDGGPVTTVLSGLDHAPDGIAVDKEAGFIYFSNMRPGSVQRVKLDGTGLTTLVSGFKVGKQLVLVQEGSEKKLYWADREGMKVMRSKIDGSKVEVLVETSKDPCTEQECKHAVGVAVDVRNGFVYWTQKSHGGFGSIHRAPIRFKPGETAATRNDTQVILKNLPEPIDLRWVDGFGLYWTDRGHQTGGNSVNRMRMSTEVMGGLARFPEKSAPLVTGLKEGIGLAVDSVSQRMWFTDLGGHVYKSKLDGSEFSTLASGQGVLVGIDYVP